MTNNNSKIRDFIASTISVDTCDNKKKSLNISRHFNPLVEIGTDSLSGLSLKLAEFYNTVHRTFLGNFIAQRKHQYTLSTKARYLKNFSKLNSFIANKSLENDTCRVFLDVTFTMEQFVITGIPRVVNQLAKCGHEMGIMPVFLLKNDVYAYDNTSSNIYKVEFKENDIFIHSDAGWNYPAELSRALKDVTTAGGKSVVVIYDLIPLIYPELSNKNHVQAFKNWMEIILSGSKEIICISKSVADDLAMMFKSDNISISSLHSVGWAHLGSNLVINEDSLSSQCLSRDFLITKPYFLSVGTVEPRKAYAVALDAMEHLWASDVDASYVIVGKYGWSQANLKAKILSHQEYGKRLFWYNSASDLELQFLYRNALALVSASLCEGFGLPVIEAAHYGLSSIVSDLPVFREIGGNSTQFFDVTDSRALALLLEKTLEKPKAAPDLDFLTWEEAVTNILSMVRRGEYQYKFP